jgi:UDP-N-acetylmuramoyl-tripeptide--D-alanyl-D-alanine ligase
MISLTFEEIARITGGKLHGINPSDLTSAYPVIDSRKVEQGCFFAALPGERVDGNIYCSEAIASGAEFVLCTEPQDLPSIVVDDSLKALTKLAEYVRAKMNKTTFIGITGSQGKTTTKDLLKSVLSIEGETVAPAGSFNNEIGVPLTLLSCTDSTRFCVLEMGARHSGDIRYLCSVAKPQIGLVLVVGSAHLGEFGSVEAIAQTKGELIDSLPDSGIAILGSYDPYTPRMGSQRSFRKILFGEEHGCDVRAADIEIREGRAHFDLVTEFGRAPVSLRLLGLHQISNALATAAVATAVGMNIEAIAAGLSTAEISSKWRMELHEDGGLVIINDAYNSNPESVSAALRTLALLAQERGGVSWAFLGKMHELGESESQEHLRIGRLASELGIDQLVSVGTDLYLNGLNLDYEAGDEMTTHYFLTQEEALGISKHFSDGDVILVKASRAEHLDELAEKLISYAHTRRLSEGSQE